MSTATGTVEPSATCRAPHVALRFSPDGHVHACCVNDLYALGRIGRQTIGEIWSGEPLRELREALDRGDYDLGCRDCEPDHLAGRRGQTHAEQFDRFPQPTAPLEWPRRVEFALSNTCNLQCIQCNGDLSSAIRAQREHRPPLPSPYGDEFFAELRELLPHIEVAVFIGGEPFLARECRRVWDLLIEMDLHPEVHVTTNGTVWDERVVRYLHSLRMNVAVSIDGVSAEVNDAVRLGSDFGVIVANRDRFLEATRSYGGQLSLNHCLLRDNWHELGDFLLEADGLGVSTHVIPVHFPSYLSLFTLDPADLRPVVEALEASGTGERLVRNRSAWDDTLAHLRAHLRGLEDGTPVRLSPNDPPRLDPAVVEEISAELETWAGQPPLTIREKHGTIVGFDVPSWAGGLDLERFTGAPVEVFQTAMAELFGPIVDLETDTVRDCTWFSYSYDLPGGRLAFRTAAIPNWGIVTVTQASELPMVAR